jgi:GNAT superfamily N-acetyltransferase
MGVASVHVRSWQAGYRNLLPDEYLDRLRPEDRAPHYDFENSDPRRPATIVALDGTTIIGFATTAAARDFEIPGLGELCALYVDPDNWGRGVGTALISEARARLVRLGFQRAILWILKGNSRAERFYRMDGWKPGGLHRTQSVWGVSVEEALLRHGLQPSEAP